MAVSLRDEDVAALLAALRSGSDDLTSTLAALNSQSTERVRQGLEGTQTAVAFEEKVTQLTEMIKQILPQFNEMGELVNRFLQDFHANDAAQAGALRG